MAQRVWIFLSVLVFHLDSNSFKRPCCGHWSSVMDKIPSTGSFDSQLLLRKDHFSHCGLYSSLPRAHYLILTVQFWWEMTAHMWFYDWRDTNEPLGWEKSYCLSLFYDYWLLITECFKEISQLLKWLIFSHYSVFLITPKW